MQNPESTIHAPITGTGAPMQLESANIADLEKTDLEKIAAIKSEQREHRVIATLVSTLGAMLFVTCVMTELACAEVLSNVLVQHRQHIQAAAIANTDTPSTDASPSSDSLSRRDRIGPVAG